MGRFGPVWKLKASIEPGTFGKNGGEAVRVHPFIFENFAHINPANFVQSDFVPIVGAERYAHFIDPIARAAADAELQKIRAADKLLCPGHGDKTVAAELLENGLRYVHV